MQRVADHDKSIIQKVQLEWQAVICPCIPIDSATWATTIPTLILDSLYLRVGGSIGPGDKAIAKSAAPMVSAIPADAAPVTDTTSPALALSSSILPTPLRLKIFVILLSAPGEPADPHCRLCALLQSLLPMVSQLLS